MRRLHATWPRSKRTPGAAQVPNHILAKLSGMDSEIVIDGSCSASVTHPGKQHRSEGKDDERAPRFGDRNLESKRRKLRESARENITIGASRDAGHWAAGRDRIGTVAPLPKRPSGPERCI